MTDKPQAQTKGSNVVIQLRSSHKLADKKMACLQISKHRRINPLMAMDV